MLKEATARDGWIRHLLNTRITVIIPIANADGFSHNRREEVGIDPNRDFAFDVAVRRERSLLAKPSLVCRPTPTQTAVLLCSLAACVRVVVRAVVHSPQSACRRWQVAPSMRSFATIYSAWRSLFTAVQT